MKKEAEYAIEPAGQRLMDDFRGDRIMGDVFKITKFVAEDNDITEYEVINSTFGETCSCPGGRHKDCKHRRMVRQYREKKDD